MIDRPSMSDLTSLVPRSSHCPVFDRLQYTKNGGGRHGIFYHVNDISVCLVDRGRGGVPYQKNTFCAHVFRFEPEVAHFSLHKHLKLQCLGQKLQGKASNLPQACSFDGGPLTPLST